MQFYICPYLLCRATLSISYWLWNEVGSFFYLKLAIRHDIPVITQSIDNCNIWSLTGCCIDSLIWIIAFIRTLIESTLLRLLLQNCCSMLTLPIESEIQISIFYLSIFSSTSSFPSFILLPTLCLLWNSWILHPLQLSIT